MSKEEYLSDKNTEVDSRTFKKELTKAKHKVNKMSVDQLNKLIFEDYHLRLQVYDDVDWYLGDVKISELGEWHHALGRNNLTDGNLKDTRDKFLKHYKINVHSKGLGKRLLYGIPAITKLIDLFQKDHYLYPIALESNINPAIRKGMSETKFDLDNGNLRSFVLALNGSETIRLYIGVRRK